MPIFRVDADGALPIPHASRASWTDELDRRDTGTGPVIVMIHGYKYRPGHPQHCPHRHLLTLSPDRPASWPRQIGFGTGHPDEGLGIAFGWNARGSLSFAQHSGRAAGQALARVIATVKDRQPDRPVHILAHSMGTDVALETLEHLPSGGVQRIISLTGAVWRSRATRALNSPAGQGAEFLNITSRENDLFDRLFELLLTAPCPGDRAIGAGLSLPNAVTVRLDCPDTLRRLDRFGAPVAPPRARICHWSTYTRPGVLRLYNRLLRQPDAVPLSRLRHDQPAQPLAALPFAQKAS